MRNGRMVLRGLGVEGAVLEDMRWEQGGRHNQRLVVVVRVNRRERGRCGVCGRRCPGYDSGAGERRWRAPDFGLVEVYIEAAAPRVQCDKHGVIVQRVPWARHGCGFTRAFEDRVAWLSVRTDKTTVSTLLGIAWRSVGKILSRVSDDRRNALDVLSGVTRIGIDEVSYRKGHRYLTVVVDHDSGRLLWAAPGRDEATLRRFFDVLGPERCQRIALVSADAAVWIGNVVRDRCPQATLCLDPFHVVQWATKALDDVRRDVWNELRHSGQSQRADSLKQSRWALWKNPADLTGDQRIKLKDIERDNQPLFRAYLLKEQLREVFAHAGDWGKTLLDTWVTWAQRCRLKPFVKLARTIVTHRQAIDDVLHHGLTNARIEAANTKLRLLTRLAFGFHSHAPLIALAMLRLGGLCPPLPTPT